MAPQTGGMVGISAGRSPATFPLLRIMSNTISAPRRPRPWPEAVKRQPGFRAPRRRMWIISIQANKFARRPR